MKLWFVTAVAVAVVVGAVGYYMFSPQPRIQRSGGLGIDGEFVAVVDLDPHSLEMIELDVYADFTCPACQRLETGGLQSLADFYGDRLLVRKHYIAGPGTAPAAKILYDIADASGSGDLVADALFKARLSHGDDGRNLVLVQAIAEHHGLGVAFAKAYQDGTGIARIKQEWSSLNNRVAFFPFIIIQREIAVGSDMQNAKLVIDSLLIESYGKQD